MAYYFASDVHAGLVLDGVPVPSGDRLAAWLDAVTPDADAVFLLGDIFDFWFEYERAIPPGYDSLLEKFRELTGSGTEIHFFPGNHDMWTLGYLSRECGLIVHEEGWNAVLCGKNVYMEHGDIQSIGSRGERLMQSVFRSKTARKIGRAVIPQKCMMRFGNQWSGSNRKKHSGPHAFRNEEEGVVRFARAYMPGHDVDLFVFGHLHVPTEYSLSPQTQLYVLGSWIGTGKPVYGRLDETGFSLLPFDR